jgi:hypothetical protein
MPSPFPGMDPYLEGYMWPDVHHELATMFKRLLVPLVRPNYAVRIEVSMYNDRVPAHELGIMFPDVEIMHTQPPAQRVIRETGDTVTIVPAPLSIPLSEEDAAWAAKCIERWPTQ